MAFCELPAEKWEWGDNCTKTQQHWQKETFYSSQIGSNARNFKRGNQIPQRGKMMVLTVDVGNTHIELGVFIDGNLQRSWRIATGVDRTEDEVLVFLHHFLGMEGVRFPELDGVALSSVVPNMTFVFTKLCQKYLNEDPFIVDHTVNLGGIRIAYQNPAAVGADRLCNVVAAYQRYHQALVVIDFGTATTFDVLNSRGEYLGGVIAPGVETTAWALYQRAAKLPKISLEVPERTIGRSTTESMQVGILKGTIRMIDGLLEEITQELGEKPKVVATGGLARIIQPRTKYIEEFIPHLVLEGLYQIFQLNRS